MAAWLDDRKLENALALPSEPSINMNSVSAPNALMVKPLYLDQLPAPKAVFIAESLLPALPVGTDQGLPAPVIYTSGAAAAGAARVAMTTTPVRAAAILDENFAFIVLSLIEL